MILGKRTIIIYLIYFSLIMSVSFDYLFYFLPLFVVFMAEDINSKDNSYSKRIRILREHLKVVAHSFEQSPPVLRRYKYFSSRCIKGFILKKY